MQSGPVVLNLGGKRFSTSRETLCSVPETMLATMFSGSVPARPEADGSFFIDRDHRSFEAILNALRRALPPRKPKELSEEEWQSDLAFFGFIDAETREEIDRAAKRRKVVQQANERMRRECRLVYDWIVARMGELKTRTQLSFVPLRSENISQHVQPPELRDLDWGTCICTREWKTELEKLGLTIIVVNASEKASFKRCAESHFTNQLVDATVYKPGTAFGSMPVAVIEFVLRG